MNSDSVTGNSARKLRVGMICPYSVSIPGGVQAQVLGLARQLRAMGHEVRVLAPCDGPIDGVHFDMTGANFAEIADRLLGS